MLIGYARFSTQDQKPHQQFDALNAAGCMRIFEERTSGARRDRPVLLAAIDFLRCGDTLVVWKLDTLARSVRQLIETIDALERRSCGFRSLTENNDTTTSGGRLIFHVSGALAEFERSITRERTMAGLDAARARGRLGGRPPAMTPTDIAVARTLLANPKISVKEVARRQGVSVSTLYKHIPSAREATRKER